ncbi:MBL fold metallo-hydrolase [Kistimonas scapharcae]|uniref:MBL fold metallo-hydrolase n=1 Tax=Kistimonas scapharcae TaxID=1036133 RepID=A0ABP8V3F3_9GAMM
MRQCYEDLWQTTLENPFSNVNTHAYLIRHDDGNILVYNTSNTDDIQAMAALGGVRLQCLSHRHEAGDSLRLINETYHPRLCVDRLEAPYINQRDISLALSGTTTLATNFVAMPTPGHTEGGFSYVYRSPTGLTYLFTGDTFFLSDAQWSTFVLADQGGCPSRLAHSLMALRELQPDVVLCSASVGDMAVAEVSGDDWTYAIDNNIHCLRDSKDSEEP